MKKMISSLLILVTLVGMLSGCGRRNLMEAPEYPLAQDVIEEELKKQKLDWTVQQDHADASEAQYTLYDAEGKRIAVLVSKKDGDSRMLKVSFMSSLREEDQDGSLIKNKEWGGIMGATTALYGGFVNRNEAYEGFTKGALDKKNKTVKTYSREKMTDEADKIYDEIIQWCDDFDGITCIYKVGQPEDLDGGLDKPKQELISLMYYNDEKYAGE